jgi:hypothetical protein
MIMNDTSTYLIRLRGQVNATEINTMSPLQMMVKQMDTTATLLTVYTDQSGLIGLMRYLHGLGFVFLSVARQ